MKLRSPKNFFSMILLCLLMISIVNTNNQYPMSNTNRNGATNSILGHSSIKLNTVYNNTVDVQIFGNTQLANYATSGSGIQGDPYILENYNMTSTSTNRALYLSSITAYTIIRNNIFDQHNATSNSTVFVYNSQHLIFENNTFKDSKVGIYFSSGSNNTIRDQNFVHIQGLSSYSLQFYRTANIVIENLDFKNAAGKGIYLADANSTIIRNTTISGSNDGIEITRSGAPYGQDNIITNVTIDSLAGVGIRDWGYNNRIANCTFRSSQTGIDLFQSTFTTVANNTFTGMTQQAISFSTSSTATTDHIITNNIISNSSTGIYAYNADVENTSILNNTIEGNSYGIDWTTTSAGVNNSLQFNTLTNNYNALNFGAYAGANITENLIKNSRSEGIVISSTQNLWVENNTIYNSNGFGLFVAGGGIAIPSVIMYNDFISNGGSSSQVLAYTGDHTVAYNYYSDHSNIDVNKDGIADSPYVLDYGTYSDPTPLVTLSSPFSLAVYPPVLVSSNSSIVYVDVSSTGNILYWQQVTDDTPATYTISQDGIPISGHDTQPWTSGQNFSVSLDGLSLGTHVFTASFSDTYGNTLVSTITVDVLDQSPPTMLYNVVLFDTYTYGVFTTFTWNGSDASPAYYSLSLNDVPQITDQVWVSGVQYNFDLSGAIIGLNKITLHLNDTTGNSATQYIYFYMVSGNSPILQNHPNPTLDISEGDDSQSLSWNFTDSNPDAYVIYHNGVNVASGSWTSGSPIPLGLVGLPYGLHNYTIVVNNTSGNPISNTVEVNVFDGTPPTITHPTDLTYQEGATGNALTWTATDLHSANFTLLVDGVEFTSGTWVSGFSIVINVDTLGVGNHTFEITVTDIGNNDVIDTVIVTVTSISSQPPSSSTNNPNTSTSTTSSPASNPESTSSNSSTSSKNNSGNGFLPGFNFWFVLISIPVVIVLQHRKLKR